MLNQGAVPITSQPTTTATALNGNQRRVEQSMFNCPSCNSIHVHSESSLKGPLGRNLSNILADNKPKHKRSQSASSRGSEAPEEEEATQEYILVSDDDDSE